MLRIFSTKWGIALVFCVIVAVAISTKLDFFAANTAVGQATDDDFSYLERANRAFIEVINAAKPAVVQITTTKLVSGANSQRQFDFFDEDLFRYWFGEPRNRRNPNEPQEEREVPGGLGSGVIVTKDGYILTNNHVIDGAEDIQVTLPNGREFSAEVIGRDPAKRGRDRRKDIRGTDIAVLKIDGENLPALEFGDSDNLQVGEWVVAIGSPFALAQTVTRGVVSAKGRSGAEIGVVNYADFIQTDAPINRGNSGGALINIHGQLVGINTAIVTGGSFAQGNVGVGFAIPMNVADRIMKMIIEKGEVERGWLGITLQEIDRDMAEKLEFERPRGALITDLGEDMPAEKAGIQRGDVIIEFNGVRIRNVEHLANTVATTEVGKTVEVKVIRQGKEKTLKVQPSKRTSKAIATLWGGIFAGLKVRELTDQLGVEYGHEGEEGVIVVDVERGSPAARAGMRRGDLIQEIEWEKVTTIAEYRQLVKTVADKPKVVLYVRHRDSLPEYVVIKNIESEK